MMIFESREADTVHFASKEFVMGKIIATLRIPESKVRRKTARAVLRHKDKSKYTRTAKHKCPWASANGHLCFG
jgi:hypothetical protein